MGKYYLKTKKGEGGVVKKVVASKVKKTGSVKVKKVKVKKAQENANLSIVMENAESSTPIQENVVKKSFMKIVEQSPLELGESNAEKSTSPKKTPTKKILTKKTPTKKIQTKKTPTKKTPTKKTPSKE